MMEGKTIFLIGMMGSGKSTVGLELSARLNLPFLDADREIEKKVGLSVSQIFEQKGEAYFRALEQQFLQHLPDEATVVACGGGLPCFFNNMELLKEIGIVIYLDAKPERLYQRIKGDGLRPKLLDYAAFEQLLTAREVYYKKAHFKIDAMQPVEAIIAEVLSLRAATTNQ